VEQPVVGWFCGQAQCRDLNSLATAIPQVQLEVQPANETFARTLYGVLAGFGGLVSLNMSAAFPLAVADPLSACDSISPVTGEQPEVLGQYTLQHVSVLLKQI
jgi:hypothetical protein